MEQPSSDDALIERWRREPAPLLPLLHAFHDRDGHLSDPVLRRVAQALRIPLADLFGTVTFYHHFSRTPGGRQAPRVCDGSICKLAGSDRLTRELSAGSMPCAGRCDEPVPVLRGDEVLVGLRAAELVARPSPLPPPNPWGRSGSARFEECCFGGIRDPGRATLAGYRRGGGYGGLEQALRRLDPARLLDIVEQSGLAGRGGAGFPTARK